MLTVVFAALTGLFIVGDDDDPRRRSRDTLLIRLPQCKLCASQRRPAPVRVNSEELRLTFVVHRDFKHKVVEQNGSLDERTTEAT